MNTDELLKKLLDEVHSIRESQNQYNLKLETYQKETSRELKTLTEKVSIKTASAARPPPVSMGGVESDSDTESIKSSSLLSTSPSHRFTQQYQPLPGVIQSQSTHPLYNHRIVLTTYPGQVGIHPIPLNWGAADPQLRGPIVVSRHPSTIKMRNAIGAYGGSYCVYRSLAIAMGELEPSHRPDLTNTEPVIQVGPFPTWGDPHKIVSLDPFGADVKKYFGKQYDDGLDIRPTIALTRAHMRVAEIEDLVKKGSLSVDGKIVVSPAGELMVTKGAVEPVWWLPGVSKRFGVDETLLRRCLFEDTGGMYPELITRPDLKVFLPPIGNLSIYIFGNPDYLSDPDKKLTVRVHDECNGSDVFGSDICTCRPYLIYGIEEAVRTAQQGGVGLIVYFRKEGRALGEVTKYLVYNARKRAEGGDTASAYFKRTENVAGVKDMRFQATMPDVLHWFGITKIDKMMSMSNMKYDAIVQSGIQIIERIPIPDCLLPPDSKVEIDAKIAAGYFSTSQQPVNLDHTKGRTWDDMDH